MARSRRWCLVTITRVDGKTIAEYDLCGPAITDLRAVDVIARLALDASRVGHGLVVSEVDPAVLELLDLAGLPVEVRR